MELWTEYEGRTIDGLFPLTKLLRPEGRSAFFLTSNGNGVSRVIRLVEPHFDEDEILARWRGVVALNHPNILKLEKFGLVELDGGSFLYAVMEPVDANLGEVVAQQRLTLPEVKQLAESLISAINTLHSHGFVHEHIEPAHVFAVGEVVKLRSDCIREAPEEQEGRQLKQRDVHDFAVVLLQALTQHPTLADAAGDRLPAPFDQIVPRAMNGEWGIAEISAALEATSISPVAPSPSSSVEPLVPAAQTESPGPLKVEAGPSPARTYRETEDVEPEDRTHPRLRLNWIVIGLAAVVLLWLAWHFFSTTPARQGGGASSEASSPAPAPASSPAKPISAGTSPGVASAPASQKSIPANDSRDQWRVIAYTYNHQDQAQHKAETVMRLHPGLHAEVFSPTGSAPYLVAIGKAMSRDEAFALAEQVRNEGLPHDTYAQNYTGKSR